MTPWAAWGGVVLMLGSIVALVGFIGWKDRQFLQGKEPRPMPEWKACLLTIVVTIVVALIARWLNAA